MITTCHSPWEWPGYDFIEDREQPAGALAYHLEALRPFAQAFSCNKNATEVSNLGYRLLPR